MRSPSRPSTWSARSKRRSRRRRACSNGEYDPRRRRQRRSEHLLGRGRVRRAPRRSGRARHLPAPRAAHHANQAGIGEDQAGGRRRGGARVRRGRNPRSAARGGDRARRHRDPRPRPGRGQGDRGAEARRGSARQGEGQAGSRDRRSRAGVPRRAARSHPQAPPEKISEKQQNKKNARRWLIGGGPKNKNRPPFLFFIPSFLKEGCRRRRRSGAPVISFAVWFGGSREMSLRTIVALAVLAVLSSAAWAQAYPSKPVRVIVTFPPGGTPDIYGRVMSAELQKIWNQSVVVENRTGAGGTIGTDYAAKAAPDGYTLLFAADATITIAPHLYSKLPYDPVRD